MASYKTVKEVLQNFLEKDNGEEGSVLAICGAWGVGKTHLCQEVLKESLVTNSKTWCEKCAYFLRGIWKFLRELSKKMWSNRNKLCEVHFRELSSAKVSSNNNNVYVSLFGLNSIDAVKRAICFGAIDSNVTNIGKIAISNQLGVSNKALSLSGDILTTFAFTRLHKKVVYFDDLERTDLKMKDLLGLISVLKEQHKCKIIIIFNAKKFDKDSDYFEYKEKVIDAHISLTPSAEEASTLFFKGSNQNGHKSIEKFCNELQITNIRTIKKILYRAEALEEYLNKIKLYGEEVKEISYSHLVFYSHKDDNPEFKSYDENTHKVKAAPIENPKIITKKIELKDFNPEDAGFPPVMALSRQIIFLIENGHFEENKINVAVESAIKYFDDQSKSQAFHSAWEEKFHGSFDDNAEEVLNAIYDAATENISNLRGSDIDNVIGLLDEYEHWNDKTDTLLGVYGEEVKDHYNFLDDVRLGKVWPEIKSEKLLKYLSDLAEKSYEDNNREKTLKDVILGMKTGGWSREDELYLSASTVDDYFNFFKETKDNDLLHASRILRQFIHLGDATAAQKKIETTVTEALIKIGKENPLNKHRLGKFGVKLPEE
jgi:hypothetical protein